MDLSEQHVEIRNYLRSSQPAKAATSGPLERLVLVNRDLDDLDRSFQTFPEESSKIKIESNASASIASSLSKYRRALNESLRRKDCEQAALIDADDLDLAFSAINQSISSFLDLRRAGIIFDISQRAGADRRIIAGTIVVGAAMVALMLAVSMKLSRLLTEKIEEQVGDLVKLSVEAGLFTVPHPSAHDIDGLSEAITTFRVAITRLRQSEAITASANRQLTETLTELEASRNAAESATKAKSSFLANMSHEMRTPMNAIIGLTHLVQRDHTNRRTPERLRMVAEAAKHLLSLIEDILDLAKVEAGKLQLENVPFSLDLLVKRAESLVSGLALEKGLQFISEIEQGAIFCAEIQRVFCKQS